MNQEPFSIQSNEDLVIRGTYYFPAGEPEFPVLLIVPGFNGSYHERHIRLLTHELPKQGIGVIAFDFTHETNGTSEGEFESLTLETEYNDILTVYDWFTKTYGQTPLHILGHSLGASLATAVATVRPEIASVIPLAPVWEPAKEIPALLNTTAETWRSLGYVEFEDNNPRNPTGKKRLHIDFYQSLLRFVPELLVHEVAAPCIIIAGTDDTIVPMSNAQAYFNHLLGEKKLTIVAECDHVFNGEVAERAVVQTIAGWINSF